MFIPVGFSQIYLPIVGVIMEVVLYLRHEVAIYTSPMAKPWVWK